MQRTNRRFVRFLGHALLGGALLACGSSDVAPPAPDPDAPECIGRFDERMGDGACRSVQVVDIEEEAVAFEREGHILHGTLTRPIVEGEHRPTTVVIVHGSGPHGRDGLLEESLGVSFGQPVPVYESLARQLAWAGVASLRYDKRSCFAEAVPTCTSSIADYPDDIAALTPTDFAEDARAAVHFLATAEGLRAEDIIVAGHSQGGAFVAELVSSEATVTGGIGLAASSMSLLDAVPGQLRALAEFLEAQDASLFASNIAELNSIASQYETELTQVLDGTWPEPAWLGVPNVFWIDYATWLDRPRSDLALSDEPLLFLNGDLDFNVWPANLELWAAWASEGGHDNVTTELLPDVTHAFVPVVSGTPPLGHAIDPSFAAAAVTSIVTWLADNDPARP